MQFLIFALLALAVSADNYNSYYNPYNYGHTYGHTYGDYGYGYPSYYSGLGYNSLYGQTYGIGAGKLNYALGGHGQYAYAPAKSGNVHLIYGSEPFLNRFESVAGPGRILFTLGSAGTSGQSRIHNPGTKSGASSSTKSNLPKIAGPSVSGGSRGTSQVGRPGHITFTQDFSGVTGHSVDKFKTQSLPKNTPSYVAPNLGNIKTSQQNLDSHFFELSPLQISQDGVQAYRDPSTISKLDSAFSVDSNFPTFPTVENVDNSRSRYHSNFAKSPVHVSVPEKSLVDDSLNYKHSYATGSELKSEDAFSSVHDISNSRKPSAPRHSSAGITADGISHQNFRSSVFPASRRSQGATSGQVDDKLPVIVAIPADDLDNGPPLFSSDVETTDKVSDKKSSIEPASAENESDVGTVDDDIENDPSFYKHSSFTGEEKISEQKDSIHKYSSKDVDSGFKSPAPEDSLTDDISTRVGGSHAAHQGSLFKFSSVAPSHDTGSRVKSSQVQSSFAFGKSYNYGTVSSPKVKSFSSKAYEEYAYIPEFSPIPAVIGDISTIQRIPYAVITPFAPLHQHDGEKK